LREDLVKVNKLLEEEKKKLNGKLGK